MEPFAHDFPSDTQPQMFTNLRLRSPVEQNQVSLALEVEAVVDHQAAVALEVALPEVVVVAAAAVVPTHGVLLLVKDHPRG